MNLKEHKLPSGAILKVGLSPFEEAKALYQVVFEEASDIGINSQSDVVEVYRLLFMKGFASKKIEAALWECFKRCSYTPKGGKGDPKIDKDTFEPLEARQDYWSVCLKVGEENIAPFAKPLYAEYGALFRQILNVQQ